MRKSSLFLILPLTLCGCGDIGSSASSLGKYMPTIGDSCESTECVTPSGKAASDAIKAERQRQEEDAKKTGNHRSVQMPAPQKSDDDSDSIF